MDAEENPVDDSIFLGSLFAGVDHSAEFSHLVERGLVSGFDRVIDEFLVPFRCTV